MADVEHDAFADEAAGMEVAPSASRLNQIVNWSGALLSVVLVGGFAVWGYKLTMRDVTDVPVIRALSGPMREAPADPGGIAAAHQGLAVNSVQAEGGVEAPPDRIVLAPPPVSLTEEDRPLAALRPVPRSERVVAEAAPDPARPAPAALALAATEEVVRPAPALAETPPPSPALAALAAAPGVRVSPRPRPRPALDTARYTLTPASAAAAPVVADADPASVTPGDHLVQLGAYDDREATDAAWSRILAQHADLMAGKKRLIQPASSGGRDFLRLRLVGFADADDARRFCTAFLARNTPCIAVPAR
jgi:hypothetical protein